MTSNIIKHGKPFVGIHLVVNLYDIKEDKLLCYISYGRDILRHVIDELKLNVMDEAGHQFNPVGYTIAYALSESHLTIHTYPEHESCYIDIFCCNPNFKPMHAVDILKDAFNTDNASYHIIRR